MIKKDLKKLSKTWSGFTCDDSHYWLDEETDTLKICFNEHRKYWFFEFPVTEISPEMIPDADWEAYDDSVQYQTWDDEFENGDFPNFGDLKTIYYRYIWLFNQKYSECRLDRYGYIQLTVYSPNLSNAKNRMAFFKMIDEFSQILHGKESVRCVYIDKTNWRILLFDYDSEGKLHYYISQ